MTSTLLFRSNSKPSSAAIEPSLLRNLLSVSAMRETSSPQTGLPHIPHLLSLPPHQIDFYSPTLSSPDFALRSNDSFDSLS